MKALTVRQPWATAIVYGFKDVENRTRQPPKALLGQVVAIHAGHAMDGSAWGFQPMRELLEGAIGYIDCYRGVIIGTARVVGWWDAAKGIEVGPPGTRQRVEASRWYTGQVGILMRGAQTIEPVKAKGQLGWWNYEG